MPLVVDGMVTWVIEDFFQLNEIYRFVVERTPTYIKVWFWSRNDPTVPHDVVGGGHLVNPSHWVSLSYCSY